MITLQRVKENPILTPSNFPWEDFLVFNPGVAIGTDGLVYLLYRAKGKDDRVSRFGLATSTDGIHFERKEAPVFYGDNHIYEKQGIEDPRMVRIDDIFYIVYTAVTEDIQVEVGAKWSEQISKRPRIALTATKDFIFYHEYGVIIPDVLGKDATLFPRKINDNYYLLFRAGVGETFLTKSSSLTNWAERNSLFDRREGFWDCQRVGVGSPPIETEKGWLLFYHGIDDKLIYRLGIMFLDLEDPSKILYRSPEPVFEPQADYEKVGFVPNVVFTCGAIEKDGQYYVYYGAADQVVGLATIDKQSVLNLF